MVGSMNALLLAPRSNGRCYRLVCLATVLPAFMIHLPVRPAFAAVSNLDKDPGPAAIAVNALGVDLLGKAAPEANVLLSPYSIQSALAMTYAGAEGQTKKEMARTLHYPGEEKIVHDSFLALQKTLETVATATASAVEKIRQRGGAGEPIILTLANRLFGQAGYDFRPAFLELSKQTYAAPLQALDFAANPSGSRQQINTWVEQQTRDRIRELVPPDGIDKETRMVLVNAVYLKASWAEPFAPQATRPLPFHANGGKAEQVPTMRREGRFGYDQRDGFSVVTVPYLGGDIQFLILLPDSVTGLAALESTLTAGLLTGCANLKSQQLVLYLPKFKVQPPLFRLGGALQALGMKSAFDNPRGSANFDRMAPRRPDEYLYLSEVFHKTFIALDEKGTEAAAATAAVMARVAAAVGARPVEVRVDRPFVYAIQHKPSGACLFLGHLNDPR